MTGEIIFLIFAFTAAWQDIRHRSVAAYVFLIFSPAAFLITLTAGDLLSGLCGALIGAGLLLISFFTNGAVGTGDGWFFVITGLLLGPEKNFFLLCTAIFLCGIFSLAVFTFRRLKTGQYAGKNALPFLPFAAAAALLLISAGMLMK